MKKVFGLLVCALFAVALLCSCGVSGSPAQTGDGAGAKSVYAAEITMASGGVIKLALDHEAAPITVDNFVALAKDGFYDGLIFHRVVDGFMIQGGDPEGTGSGGPGHTIKGEFSANGWDNPISHTRGVISMARRGNNMDSGGSQFFITQADRTELDGQYAAFGHVTEGMDVVDEIASVTTDGNARPLEDIVIKSIRILD
ncbi:MAG TPA: peptidylprolyl isomerase [Clostridiales bacterium]|nr:peptidylprolyl isomerase [Clostridiales bacterium]